MWQTVSVMTLILRIFLMIELKTNRSYNSGILTHPQWTCLRKVVINFTDMRYIQIPSVERTLDIVKWGIT